MIEDKELRQLFLAEYDEKSKEDHELQKRLISHRLPSRRGWLQSPVVIYIAIVVCFAFFSSDIIGAFDNILNYYYGIGSLSVYSVILVLMFLASPLILTKDYFEQYTR